MTTERSIKTEHPILFSAPMVRALIAKRKRVTRRIVRMQDLRVYLPTEIRGDFPIGHHSAAKPGRHLVRINPHGAVFIHKLNLGLKPGEFHFVCPYIDTAAVMRSHTSLVDLGERKVWQCTPSTEHRLWVRETFWCDNDTDQPEMAPTLDCGSMLWLGPDYATVQYAATPECCNLPKLERQQTVDPEHKAHKHCHGHWWLGPPSDWDGSDGDREHRGVWSFLPTGFWTKHPSIHMPRWASRLAPRVKHARLERLHDTDDADAVLEGVQVQRTDFQPLTEDFVLGDANAGTVGEPTPRAAFAAGWDRINGDRVPWKDNPWVWRIEFQEGSW